MRRLNVISVILFLCILAGCSGKEKAENELGIDLSEGHVVKSIDTHDGFLGDGITYTEYDYNVTDVKALKEELKENENWRPLPLSDNLQKAVYGDNNGEALVTSFDEEIPAIPEIEDGYYFFKDRHSESTDSSDDSELFERYSFNFDIFIYDANKHILYFFRLDT